MESEAAEGKQASLSTSAADTSLIKEINIQAVWDGYHSRPVDVSITLTLMTRPNARMILLDTSDSRVLSAAIKSTQLTRAESSRIRTSKNCNNLNLLAGDRVTTTMPRQFRRFSQVLKENERAASKKVETKSYRQHIFPSRRHFAEKREPVYTDSSGACETHFLHAQDPMAEQPALSHHFDPKYPSTDTFVSPKCFSEGALCLSNLSNHNSSHGPKDQGHSRSLSEFKGSFSSSRKANAILMHPVLPIIGGANWIREHKRWRLPTSDTSRPSQVICESSSQRERIAFEKTPTHKPYLNQEHIISTLKPGGMLPQHNWQRYVHPPLAMWNQYRSSSESAVARILINVDSCLGCRKYYGSRPLCAGLGFSSSEKYALSPCSRLLETKTSDSPQYGLQGIQSDYCYAFPLLTHHNLDDDRRFPQGQKSSLSDADLESCVMGSDNSACESCSLSSRDANPQDKSLRRLISTTPIDNEGELKSLEPLIFSREASCLCTDELAWLVDKGRLCISFGANIEIGSCVVEVEAKIFLSKRNFEGWQSFNIPGLFTSTGPNTSIYLNFDVQALRSALIREAPTDKILKSVGSKINLDEFLFDPCSLSGIEASNPNHISGYLQTPTGSLLQLKLKGGVHYVSSWDCAVKLYSVISSDGDERIQIEHFASLLCVPPSKDYFEDIVSFALVVSHGLSSGGSYDLKASEGLIRHNQYPYGREASEHDKHTAKIVVHRKFKDFGKALSICFKCSYPNHEDVSIALPTFRPLFGKVLSEKIWLAKPPPPKTVQRCQRTFLSSWRFTERLVGRIRLMCFDRIRLPPTFPKGFKDNVVIKITHLHPVRFVGLERLDCSNRSIHPYDVVQSAETTIYNVFGGALECRMSLELQVGEVQPLVKIDICDWIPIYSIVGSRLSSELVGEWREIGKRQVGLFRQRWMNVGQRLGVEMCWRQTAQFHDSRYDRNSTAMLECELPKIVDKQVLGGRLACNVENALIAITHCNRKGAIYAIFHQSERDVKLPTLGPGYSMHLSFYQQNRPKSSNFRRLHQRPYENNRLSLETIDEESLSQKSDKQSDGLFTAKSSTTTSSTKPVSQMIKKNSNVPADPKRNQNCLYLLAGTWLLVILIYGLLYCCGIPTASIGLLPQAYTILVSKSTSSHYRTSDDYVTAHVLGIEETHQGEGVVLEQGLQSPPVVTRTGFETSIYDPTNIAADHLGDGASQTTSGHDKKWRDRVDGILGWSPIP